MFFKTLGSWRDVADAARTTVGMEPGKKEPSIEWKRKILRAEHSPIRQLIFKWKWTIPYWVSVHFVRHKIGIEHFVSTQRTDRTGVNRDEKLQSDIVTHECIANAQAVLSISRKRMCNQAARETQVAWQEVLQEIAKVDTALYASCVPECVYRGFCPELKSCGFDKTKHYQNWLNIYREIPTEEVYTGCMLHEEG